ncbi:unnamed protein product [Rhizopus stolonifer]
MNAFDTFLSEIIVDQDRNVALRWADKSCEEEYDIRPDATISTQDIRNNDKLFGGDFAQIFPHLLNLMPGEIFTLSSVDKADISSSDDTTNEELFQISTEYLQSLNPGNYPPSQFHLKIGSVVILLRNLNVKQAFALVQGLSLKNSDPEFSKLLN